MVWKSIRFVATGLNPWQRGLLALIFTTALFADSEPTLELDTGGHRAKVTAMVWTPDGRYIATSSEDKTIRIYSAHGGEFIRAFRGYTQMGHEGIIQTLAISPDGKVLAVGGYLSPDGNFPDTGIGAVRLLDFATGQINAVLKGHYSSVRSLRFSPNGRFIAAGADNGDLIIWSLEGRNDYSVRHKANAHYQRISALDFSPNNRYLITGSYDRSIALWDLQSKDINETAKYAHYQHKYGITQIRFSAIGDTFVSASRDGVLKKWQVVDFLSNKEDIHGITIWKSYAGYTDAMELSHNSIFIGGMAAERGKDSQIHYPIVKIHAKTGQILGKYEGHTNSISSIAISRTGNVASAGGNHSEAVIWESKNFRTITRLMGQGKSVFSVGFGSDGKHACWGSQNKSGKPNGNVPFKSFSLTTFKSNEVKPVGACLHAITEVGGKQFLFFNRPYEKQIMINDHPIYLQRSSDWIRSYTFTPDGNFAIIGSSAGLTMVNANQGVILGEFIGHEGPVWAVSVSPDGKRLLSGSGDQTMKLWEIESRALIATIFVARDDEWIVALPNGYYAASPNGHQYFGWKINRREDQSALFYSFDQFDLIYNRPDKVYKALFPEANAKSSDPFLRGMAEKIDRLKAHWQKRVATHGFKPEELEAGVKISAPEVKFAQRPADYDVVTSGDYTLSATITDPISAQQIVGYRIYVNGVPVGKALHEKDSKGNKVQGNSFSLTETIRLSSTGGGRNVIEVSGLNNKGVESRREAIRLMYKPLKKRKPQLYVAAFGVDDYKGNGSFRSLEFAKKDAEEIRAIFKKYGDGYYEKIHVLDKGIYNRDVTRASIAGLKEFWKNSTVDDSVIVYFSGHGMSASVKRPLMGRDYDDYEFYFVTSTAEILRSEKDGIQTKTMSGDAITIDQIRDLMETTPARQKILMLDTCQSFVDDKSGGKGAGQKTTVVKLKNGGKMTMRGEHSRGSDEATEKQLQQEAEYRRFFPELRRGVGTIEISAATNGQVAQEGISIPGIGELQNGVFTYAIKTAIEKNAATKGGKITAKSLRAYVLNQVEELTRKAEGGTTVQIPMVARDIAGRDFTLLGK